METRAAAGDRADLAAPLRDLPIKIAAGTRHPRLHRGEGDGPRRRAHPGRRRLHQPPHEAHEAAVGPDHRLRARRRQGQPRPAASCAARSRRRRPTTPMWSKACLRARSPIPAGPRSRPWPIRRGPRSSTSSPTVPAATPSPRATNSTSATSPGGARSRRARPTPGADEVDRVIPDGASTTTTTVPAGAANAAAGRGRLGRGFDASEGTNKDPLKNKTFDLSNPKNVPTSASALTFRLRRGM